MMAHRSSSIVAMLAALVLASSVTGCSKSASNAMTESGSGAAASAGSSMMQAGASLMQQLGGLSGVAQLADAFGANIAANPVLSKLLDAAAITQTKQGLVNEVAKASNMAPPNPGVDLLTTLSGKGLDATATSELTSALSSAADQVHLGAAQKSAVLALLAPITNSLAGK